MTTRAAIATVIDRQPCTARLLIRGAGLLLVFGLVTACSRDDAASTTTPPIDSTTLAPVTPTAPPVASPAATAVETPTTADVLATAAPTAPLVAPDGPTLLQQAFDLTVPGYHFVTTATVNGVPALTAEGDHIGGGTRLTVMSQNATSGYVILPEGTWVLDAGVWKETEDPPPVTDPITALRAPSTVAVAAFTATGATLIASYPPAALALEGDAPVDITFEIEGTTLRSITYVAPSAVPASVRADISALVDTSPVVAPNV